MPADPGMAFIVVDAYSARAGELPAANHRAPTALPIEPITDGAAIEPNLLYILASDAVSTLAQGRLHLVTAARRAGASTTGSTCSSPRLPRTAEKMRSRSSCPAYGYDGTLGAKAIKEKGGFTIAQIAGTIRLAAVSRKCRPMRSPRARSTCRLPVEDMAGKLIEYARSLGRLDPDRPAPRSARPAGRWAPRDLRDPARADRA